MIKLKYVNFTTIKTFLGDADFDSRLISSKIFSSRKNYKYFIGYMDDVYKTNAFSIILQKMNAYVKSSDDETKWMHFLIEDDKLLNKYNDNWKKITNSRKKEISSANIDNKFFFKTKVNVTVMRLLIFRMNKCLE